MEKKLYTIWVGGTEVVDHYVPFDVATSIADEYKEDGYDDVLIEESKLAKILNNLNQGKYLHEIIDTPYNSNFGIGVAAYPEKHMEAPSMDSDLRRLKEKVDAGADYIVTQMFFDNQKYFSFIEKARAIGINVPIIPGIKPIAVERHLQVLPQVFRLDLPEALIKEVEKCKNNKEIRQVGIEWSIQQSKELMAANVPVVHFYSMGKSDNIKAIASAIF